MGCFTLLSTELLVVISACISFCKLYKIKCLKILKAKLSNFQKVAKRTLLRADNRSLNAPFQVEFSRNLTFLEQCGKVKMYEELCCMLMYGIT